MSRKFSLSVIFVLALLVSFVAGACLTAADAPKSCPMESGMIVQTTYPGHVIQSKTAELLFSMPEWHRHWKCLTGGLDQAYSEISSQPKFPKTVIDRLFSQVFKALGTSESSGSAAIIDAYFGHVRALTLCFGVEPGGSHAAMIKPCGMAAVVDFNPLDVFSPETFGREGVNYKVVRSTESQFAIQLLDPKFSLTIGGTKIAGTAWYAVAVGCDSAKTLDALNCFAKDCPIVANIKDTTLLKEVTVPGKWVGKCVARGNKEIESFCEGLEPVRYEVRANTDGTIRLQAKVTPNPSANPDTEASVQAICNFTVGGVSILKGIAAKNADAHPLVAEVRPLLNRIKVRSSEGSVVAEFTADLELLGSAYERITTGAFEKKLDKVVEKIKGCCK